VIIPLIPISNMSSLSLHHELKFHAAMEPTKKKKQNRRFLCTQIQVLICAKAYIGI
jgi:superfamily II DNA helicase RecQ